MKINPDEILHLAVRFLTGDFPFSAELQAFFMAIQGAVAVRNGPNKDRKLHWFHAFALSVIGGYAGALFGFLWMGKPCSMLSNDLNMSSCIIAFVIVNYLPFGFKLCNSLAVTIVTVMFAQLFRCLGLVRFVGVAYDIFKDNPSKYYPIPVFGPILYGTMLGNMGGFFMKGFEGHVQNGMPWPMQNGLFCAAFYHFFINDTMGPVGSFLRKYLSIRSRLGLDDKTFAIAFVSLFMQIMGILQIPAFLGPSFSPFGVKILSPFMDSSTWIVGKGQSEYSGARHGPSQDGKPRVVKHDRNKPDEAERTKKVKSKSKQL